MDNHILVKVEGVSKKFCRDLRRSLWYGVKDITAELFGVNPGDDLRKREFWAVDDVSFELKRGECLGLIGHNGAGKSTLLKMLNGLIKPDKGRITMKGRIGALIELGAGFNPILTGRENIYNNGAVLGFSRKEIDKKFDAIVNFAEIEEFIDTPVQNYSSGMKVRLGFSVAAQMEPDVLLVDEVLAVGDIGFRIKCYNEIFRIMKNAAIIFVSHSMPQVGKVCTRGIMMSNGTISHSSRNISEVIVSYYNSFKTELSTIEGSGRAGISQIRMENGTKEITFNNFSSKAKNDFGELENFKSLKFELQISMEKNVNGISCLISVSDTDQKAVMQVIPGDTIYNTQGSEMVVDIKIDDLVLNTGNYTLSFHLLEGGLADWGETLVGIRSAIRFSVKQKKFIGSAPVLQKAEWKVYN